MTSLSFSEQLQNWPITDDSIRDVFARMLHDGSWGRYHGPHCDSLRVALSEFHSVEHAILCCSGTAAMELALRAIPVAAGDEVILAAYDFKSNFINVLITGCTPVLIDTVVGFPVPDLNQLEDAITERTRAIVVSHLHGNIIPMQAVRAIAARRGIAVIEDACQAPGAMIDGRRAGTWGDVGILSFGGSKLLTAGRGGAVLTSNAQIAQRIRLHTQRGNDAYPLSEMQAAVLLPQLTQLDARNAIRRERLQQLIRALGNDSALCPAFDLSELTIPNGCLPSFYKAAFLSPRHWTEQDRDRFCESVRERGVPLDPGFSALHRIHSKRRFQSIGDLPNANRLHEHLMTLHHTPLLCSAETMPQIAGMMMSTPAGHCE